MDRRITFQRKVITTNGFNEDQITGWTDLSTFPTVWAAVKESNGNEAYAGDKLTAERVTTFTIRYRSDLNEEYRISYDGNFYDVLSILEVSRKRFLEIKTVTNFDESTNIIEEDSGFSSGFR